MCTHHTHPKKAVHAKVGPIQYPSFEEMALLPVRNLKLIVVCTAFIETTGEKHMLSGSWKVLVPKNMRLENVSQKLHTCN